jgi:hypothetical protein
MSIANYGENFLLDAIFNSAVTPYVKLHTGDPGEAGTANGATETTRKLLNDAAAVSGTYTSPNALAWTGVAASETYSHVSIWDAASGGNCFWSGALTAPVAVTAGGNFTIAAGALTVTLD